MRHVWSQETLEIWFSGEIDSDEYQQAVSKGMLFDWNEDDILSDYGPYIKQNMPYALEKNANLSGGTVYGFGFDVARDATARQDFMYTWDLRWDLYKELGYPEIKTLDDMVDVLGQMKEICPTDDTENNLWCFLIQRLGRKPCNVRKINSNCLLWI